MHLNPKLKLFLLIIGMLRLISKDANAQRAVTKIIASVINWVLDAPPYVNVEVV